MHYFLIAQTVVGFAIYEYGMNAGPLGLISSTGLFGLANTRGLEVAGLSAVEGIRIFQNIYPNFDTQIR